MILSNITTPLLGMVDTAVMGHMGAVGLMAGASIGALVISQIYWLCGFLRMAITGVSAQAYGADNTSDQAKSFFQSVFLALAIGLCLFLLTPLIIKLGTWFAEPHPTIHSYVKEYITVRLWGAPLALMNFALVGWLIGQQKMKVVLVLTVIANLINGILDIVFVYYFDMSITGLALASVIAESSIAIFGIFYILHYCLKHLCQWHWLQPQSLLPFLKLNYAIFFRNLALQSTLAFITFQGARLGQDIVALNAILMQFFVLTALGLDGIAQATEATVGEAKGKGNKYILISEVKRGVVWSFVLAMLYTVVFALFHKSIISLLTDLTSIVELSEHYHWVIILLPLVGHWCFVFDGVFVALTRGVAMQNSMILSSGLCFFPIWWLFQSLGNHGLWIAMMSFLLARGLTLGSYFMYLKKHNRLLA